jgi:SAM-dependent methyltransferase
VSSPDIVHHKPGIFILDRCCSCGHIFQNPRLNEAGLTFYYRDTYDGLGAKSAEFGLSLPRWDYKRRARTLLPYAVPRTWLDVGTGFGHFCQTAKRVWPQTTFAGLDPGDGVWEALRKGRIDEAHQGFFPDRADRLAGKYEVVSMHHYLEHTTDPKAEIRAAARVLGPPMGLGFDDVPPSNRYCHA